MDLVGHRQRRRGLHVRVVSLTQSDNVDDTQHYEQIDLPIYRKSITPMLLDEVLDFHTHVWIRDQWLGGCAGQWWKPYAAVRWATLGMDRGAG